MSETDENVDLNLLGNHPAVVSWRLSEIERTVKETNKNITNLGGTLVSKEVFTLTTAELASDVRAVKMDLDSFKRSIYAGCIIVFTTVIAPLLVVGALHVTGK